jgi:chaperone modulatory protein CbpM
MKIEITDAKWLCEHTEVSLEELVELSGLPAELLLELIDYGALAPIETESAVSARPQAGMQPAQWRFTSDCVIAVQTVSRLREDFDLDANAISVALMLIERVHGLEAQLQALQSQLPQLKKQGQAG